MKNPINRKSFLLIAVLASLAFSVQAQNLVQNPGFETGNFTGWTLGGNTAFTMVTTTFVHSGSFAASLGPTTTGTLSQNIATTPGVLYNVSFWLLNQAGGTNSFAATFGGANLITPLTNAPAFSYTQVSQLVNASSASTALVFTYSNGPSFWHLDDVSVTAVAVPEPNTAALLGVIAAGALGLRAWRKRKAA